jgi:hypothetical protein
MSGKEAAPQGGRGLQQSVVDLAQALGLKAQIEVTAARRLWGAKRHIDVVLTHEKTGKKLGIECKFQAGTGSAEEKIPATIKDIESWPIPGIVVIEGKGFSANMQGYLMSTGKVVWFEDLGDWLRLFFAL